MDSGPEGAAAEPQRPLHGTEPPESRSARMRRLASDADAVNEVALDPGTARRERTRRHYRYNVWTLPITRLIGFNAVLATAMLLSPFTLGAFTWDAFRPVIIGVEAYCLLSWLALRSMWLRFQPFDLQTPLLVADLLVWAVIIYVSGAERSWLFFILILRVADQSYTSFKRAMIFAHLAPLIYFLMLAYVEVIDGRDVSVAGEAAKLFCLYGASLYLALTGRTAGALRERTNAAIRLAKDLIVQLEEKSVELEASSVRAEAASGAKSRFLANMSHELRTPLNAIIGYTELLQEEDEGRRTGIAPDLEHIRSASLHLLSLIDDVLDIAKIEAGRMTLYLEHFDVEALIEDVIKTVQPLARRNDNALEVELANDLGEMHSDLTRLRQMLLNVLGNASKFTEHGVITLAVRREHGSSGDELIFAVRDTGIGMSEGEQSRLFQPFSQADPSTTRRYGGSGLGLVITKRFAEQMGGTIQVDSRTGAGTTFTIRLPAVASVESTGEFSTGAGDRDTVATRGMTQHVAQP